MTSIGEHLARQPPSRDIDELCTENEDLLHELIRSHPPCSMELLREEVLRTLSSTVTRKPIEFLELESVGKSYEDAYLRPPLGHERLCVRGDKCMCNFMAKLRHGPDSPLAFIGVEFLLPEAARCLKTTNRLPATRGRCLVCIRYIVTFLYTMARCNPRFSLAESTSSSGNTLYHVDHVARASSSDKSGRPRRRSKQHNTAVLSVDNGEGSEHLQDMTDPIPYHENLTNCEDGYLQDKMLYFEEEFMNTVIARQTRMGCLTFRPFVRFCSTDFKFAMDKLGRPYIVQCGMGCDRHLNGLALSASAQQGAPLLPQSTN